MEWSLTLAAIASGAGVCAFSAWKSGQPRKDSLRTRWISWPLVTVLSGAMLIVGLAHAASLMGFAAPAGNPLRR